MVEPALGSAAHAADDGPGVVHHWFVVLGLLMVVSTFLAPEVAIWILMAAAASITIFLFAYSYQVWKSDPSKR